MRTGIDENQTSISETMLVILPYKNLQMGKRRSCLKLGNHSVLECMGESSSE